MAGRMFAFDSEVARLVGADAAAVFEGLSWWVAQNAANGRNRHDGRYWSYNSVKALSELFPWLSDKQVRGALRKLVDAGLVVEGCYNKTAYDRTKWYSIGERGLDFYSFRHAETANSTCPDEFFDLPKWENRKSQNGEPIPVDNQLTNHLKTEKEMFKEKEAAKKRAIHRQAYGEFGNVYLSDEELAKLKAEYPNDWKDRIERVSAYCASRGKTYRNYLATIRAWARKDEEAVKAKGKENGNGNGNGCGFSREVYDAIGYAIGARE